MTLSKSTSKTVAVDQDYFWQPLDTCPLGVKVQLLGLGKVACYGLYSGKDTFWKAWAPLPKIGKNILDLYP